MRNIKVLTALLLTLFTVSVKTFAQTPLSNRAEVSLLTCGPGNELYSVFGHTAIRVYDPATRFDVVYNFGTFDFDTPNFYAKFTKGDLQYFVSASSYDDFIYTYQYYNRDVYEQFLNLTAQQKQDIANELNHRLTSEDKFYTYKFIHRNCTTMVADILNKYLTQKISLTNEDSGLTYRKIIRNKLSNGNHFFEDLGISLTFGAPTDDVQDKLFLPKELLQGVADTKTPVGPLAKPTVTVFKAQPVKPEFSFNNFIVYTIAILILLSLTGFKLMQRSYLAIAGLMGIFFVFIGFYSSHSELIWNYNVLLCNPLLLVVLYFNFRGNKKAIVISSYTCLACIGIYLLYMLNKPHLTIILPLLLLTVVLLVRVVYTANKA
ncbi:DUF4105 domain-containing protein [Flavobacterium sp. DG1-102-2]|uniref:lipoprotein N-acyltransferase Lnb domain-containing protein n=1 Tax=Flavobacterium sp. DG1-102-2 TaxID=3081663 RepID=UPI00294A54E9|nr:DUF4105 domain-containing protein [Flavobacterium sp. DG1-102-2]MDV6168401.1 DUF4105 domain-containing protein [Flavobacterium sp. DG1-102-2]